jgi:hypothetical protein
MVLAGAVARMGAHKERLVHVRSQNTRGELAMTTITRISDGKRAAIHEAAQDFAHRDAGEDVVDVATKTCNYWWQGLDDHQTRIVLRYFGMVESHVKARRPL